MSKLDEFSGKVVSSDEAKKINERHKENRKQIEKTGETFIESYFVGAETLKEMVSGTPIKSIMGLKINLGISESGEKTITLEAVSKDKTISQKSAINPPACPIYCT
jgi:uncharacterized protein with GYD domain